MTIDCTGTPTPPPPSALLVTPSNFNYQANTCVGKSSTFTVTGGTAPYAAFVTSGQTGATGATGASGADGANGQYGFQLQNNGNASGQYTLSITGGTIVGILTDATLLPTSATNGGQINKTSNGQVTMTSSSVLCAPIPAPLTMTTPL